MIIAVVVGVIGWRIQQTSTPSVVPTEVELKYDDGTPESFTSSSRGGYLVSFTPPSIPFAINKIRMCGMTFGSGWEDTEFEVQIWDKEQKVLYSASYPFTLFPAGVSGWQLREAPTWVEVSVPDIEVKTDFSIHLYTGTGKLEGVQLGNDDSARSEQSDLTILTPEGIFKIRDTWPYPSNMWFADKSKVNWMIRVIGRSLE